jgi:hypothetical protein
MIDGSGGLSTTDAFNRSALARSNIALLCTR